MDRTGHIGIRDRLTAQIIPELSVDQPSNVQVWSLVRASAKEVWAGCDNGHLLVYDSSQRCDAHTESVGVPGHDRTAALQL